MSCYQILCSFDLLVIVLQYFSAVSAANIGYPPRLFHSDNSDVAIEVTKRTLSSQDTKIAPGLVRPTLLVAQ